MTGPTEWLPPTGKTAYIQWCRKMVETERFSCLAYGTDIGVEMNDALGRAEHSAVESAVERTITEALMINPKTEYVREFEFPGGMRFCSCPLSLKEKNMTNKRCGLW